VCEEKLEGVPELSATLSFYLGGYDPLSSKHPGLHLLVEFLPELSFCFHLLMGSSSVLVTGVLV